MLRRRPCSVDDIASGLGMHPNEVLKSVEHLQADGLIDWSQAGGTLYCKARQQPTAGWRPIAAETSEEA